MSLFSRILYFDQLFPDMSDAELAEKIVGDLPVDDLISAITDEVRSARRGVVRGLESSVFSSLSRGTTDKTKKALAALMKSPGAAAQFKSLMSKSFALGNGDRTTWGEATAEQHRFRANMLNKQVLSLSETRDAHLNAANLIDDAGATCLQDFDQERGVA